MLVFFSVDHDVCIDFTISRHLYITLLLFCSVDLDVYIDFTSCNEQISQFMSHHLSR